MTWGKTMPSFINTLDSADPTWVYTGELESHKLKLTNYKKGVNVGMLPMIPFTTLSYLTGLTVLSINEWMEELSYICPHTGNKYYGAIPVAVLFTNNVELPKPKRPVENLVYNYLAFSPEPKANEDLFIIGDLSRSLLGHGQNLALMCDGVTELELEERLFKINDKVSLIVKTWKKCE